MVDIFSHVVSPVWIKVSKKKWAPAIVRVGHPFYQKKFEHCSGDCTGPCHVLTKYAMDIRVAYSENFCQTIDLILTLCQSYYCWRGYKGDLWSIYPNCILLLSKKLKVGSQYAPLMNKSAKSLYMASVRCPPSQFRYSEGLLHAVEGGEPHAKSASNL